MHVNVCVIRYLLCTLAVGMSALHGCFLNSGEGWVGIVRIVSRMKRKYAQTRTHTENIDRGCHKENTLKCGGCCTMAATTYAVLGGRGDTYRAAADITPTKQRS